MASASADGKCTTEGVNRRPSASAMTSGMPESTVATSELVVPKSMPTILLMQNHCGFGVGNVQSLTERRPALRDGRCGWRGQVILDFPLHTLIYLVWHARK